LGLEASRSKIKGGTSLSLALSSGFVLRGGSPYQHSSSSNLGTLAMPPPAQTRRLFFVLILAFLCRLRLATAFFC